MRAIITSVSAESSSPSINAEILSISPSPVLTSPKLGPQLRRNGLARPEDARTHCSDRAIHDAGDILVTQTLDLAQGDSGLQFLWQLLERIVHGLCNLPAHHHVLWRVQIA